MSLHVQRGHRALPTSGQALLASMVRRASPPAGQAEHALWAPRVYGKQIQEVPEPIHLIHACLWDCRCVHTCPPASVSRCHQQSSRISLKLSLGSTISNQMFLSALSCLTLGAHMADGGGRICREKEMHLSDLLLNLRNKGGEPRKSQHLCGGPQLSSQC